MEFLFCHLPTLHQRRRAAQGWVRRRGTVLAVWIQRKLLEGGEAGEVVREGTGHWVSTEVVVVGPGWLEFCAVARKEAKVAKTIFLVSQC